MESATKLGKDFRLRGNPVVDVPIVGNLVNDELGQLVLARHNEKFKGVEGVEAPNNHAAGGPISYSNFPRAVSYATILRQVSEETGLDFRLLRSTDILEHWGALPERNSTYTDTEEAVVFPHQGSNEELRLQVLNVLGALKTSEALLVSGLGIEKADNKYGFALTKTDYTKHVPLTSLLEQAGAKEIQVFTPSDQSGLRRLYRSGDELNARDGRLLDANDGGRVQIVQDPQGRAENLEKAVKDIELSRQRAVEEITSRHEAAMHYLKTGELPK